MIFDELFYQTDQGEVFQKSQCIQHEHAIAGIFHSLLLSLGYKNTGPNSRTWQRGHRTVIVCFADDFGVCRTNYSCSAAAWFAPDTVIITDNHVPFPTQYQVCQTPISYFGIYNYIPANQQYRPARRFNLSVNRLDTQRQLLLLELTSQSVNAKQMLATDYINFNCKDAYGSNDSVDDIRRNFLNTWDRLGAVDSYNCQYQQLIEHMPIRNHNFSVEQVQVSAYINLVIETYAGDATIAFSEKIFRALLTPAPWTVYSAKNAVDYLKTVGFDVLEDLVDHSYNTVVQDNSPHGVGKVQQYISSSINIYQQLLALDAVALAARCQAAASHNQLHLSKLQQQWPADFAAWLPLVMAHIQ